MKRRAFWAAAVLVLAIMVPTTVAAQAKKAKGAAKTRRKTKKRPLGRLANQPLPLKKSRAKKSSFFLGGNCNPPSSLLTCKRLKRVRKACAAAFFWTAA